MRSFAQGICFTLPVLLLAAPGNAGTLYFSQDTNSNGLFTLNTMTGAATPVGTTSVVGSTVGLALGDSPGVLFGSKWQGLLRIDKDGSGAVQTGTTGAEGLEYAGGILYGTINGSFFTLNTTTGAIGTTLASPAADIEGLAYGNGVIYGLEGASNGRLYKYNIGSNSWSLVGPTGVRFDQSGLAYDSELNVLYGIGNQDHNLYRINPATGAASAIGSTGLQNQGGGLAFEASAPVPLPSAVWGGLALGGLIGLRRLRKGS